MIARHFLSAAVHCGNHYALYHGQADGAGMQYVGRNEFGSKGNPGQYSFGLPETWDIEVATDERLYVVAWEDGGPQMFIGNFTRAMRRASM